MKKSRRVRVIKNIKIGRQKPRVDFRAKRVRVALRVPRGMMGVKIPKDEGGGGRRKERGVESPRARDRRGSAKGRNIGVEKGECGRTEVNFDPKEVRRGIRGRESTKGPRRMCQSVSNERQHAPTARSRAGSRRSISTVALIPRNPKGGGRLKLGFLDKDKVEGVKGEEVSELEGTGPHSVCVPLKHSELRRRRARAKRRRAKGRGRRRKRRKSRK